MSKIPIPGVPGIPLMPIGLGGSMRPPMAPLHMQGALPLSLHPGRKSTSSVTQSTNSSNSDVSAVQSIPAAPTSKSSSSSNSSKANGSVGQNISNVSNTRLPKQPIPPNPQKAGAVVTGPNTTQSVLPSTSVATSASSSNSSTNAPSISPLSGFPGVFGGRGSASSQNNTATPNERAEQNNGPTNATQEEVLKNMANKVKRILDPALGEIESNIDPVEIHDDTQLSSGDEDFTDPTERTGLRRRSTVGGLHDITDQLQSAVRSGNLSRVQRLSNRMNSTMSRLPYSARRALGTAAGAGALGGIAGGIAETYSSIGSHVPGSVHPSNNEPDQEQPDHKDANQNDTSSTTNEHSLSEPPRDDSKALVPYDHNQSSKDKEVDNSRNYRDSDDNFLEDYMSRRFGPQFSKQVYGDFVKSKRKRRKRVWRKNKKGKWSYTLIKESEA
jgi:hypothetical protein